MRQWHHSGFGIHAGHRIQKDDHDGLEKFSQCILRTPFSLEKITTWQHHKKLRRQKISFAEAEYNGNNP